MVGKKKNLPKPVSLELSGKELPWVSTATHLGHEFHESGTMDYDATVKRAEFIGKSTEIRETFFFASPVEVLKAVKWFAGDLYGGNLWQLRGDMAQQMFRTWNTCLQAAALSWPGRCPVPRTPTWLTIFCHVVSAISGMISWLGM